MKKFISLLSPELTQKLSKKGLSKYKISEALNKIGDLSLFQFVIYLFQDKKDSQPEVQKEFLKKLLNEEDIKALKLTEQDINDSIATFFSANQNKKRQLNKDILKAALRLYAEKYGISAEDSDKAFELIMNGAALKDTQGILEDTAAVLKKLPAGLKKLILHPVSSSRSILKGVFRDIISLPESSKNMLTKLLNNEDDKAELDSESVFHFNNTLQSIFELAVIEDLSKWIADVLSYESVQLALMAYASTQGVNLTPDDIRQLRDFLSDGDPAHLTNSLVQKISSELKT